MSNSILTKKHSTKSSLIFKLLELKPNELFQNKQPDYNHLFFLLHGNTSINCTEATGKYLHSGEFFFIPFSTELTIKAIEASKFIVFSFDNFSNIYEQIYFRELWNICSDTAYSFKTNQMNPVLSRFMSDVEYNLKLDFNRAEIQQLKHEELFCVMTSSYTREEMAAIFHPIVGKSYDFRKLILKNYLNVKNIEEMVSLTCLKRKTFDRQFINEFNTSPYQWILNKKAMHVRYTLSETNDKMGNIMKKYGFSIAPHFTRFCKEQFGFSPMELRKQLQREKNGFTETL